MTTNITISKFEDLRDDQIENGKAVVRSDGFDKVTEWTHPFGKACWREI